MNGQDSTPVTDAPLANWVDRFAPSFIRGYLRLSRLDRPIGTWLLLLPCWWSVAIATMPSDWPSLWIMFLFALGAIAMRGAGCTFNDIIDREFDAQVERTRNRPIPSGQVSIPGAIIWLIAQSLVGLYVLWQFPPLARWIGATSLILVAIYPFMKRITWWPQLFLGLAFNWGALMGEAAIGTPPSLAALLFYLGGIAWTLGYDTIYAHQDKEDDAIIGVKSTARRLGDATRIWLFIFYGISLLFFMAGGVAANMAWPYWIGLCVTACHFTWQSLSVEINDPNDCLSKFRTNRHAGLILFLSLVLGRLADF